MTQSRPHTAIAPRTVICPCCGGESIYAPSNGYRPFCSERCKQLDLGAWASEGFRMPAETPSDDEHNGDLHLQH